MGAHLINGKFQSDKYPTCPAGKVPLSTADKSAQDGLWRYAKQRRHIDAEFSDDLEQALRLDGYTPPVRVVVMAHVGPNGAVRVKDIDFFTTQGGFTEEWGAHWIPVIAKDLEDAREIALKTLPGARVIAREP
jgi:hypothetical protein